MLAVQFPIELEERLAEAAKAAGLRPDECVIEAVMRYLEYLQDLEDCRAAEDALLAIREGRARTFTLEEVMAEHGLAD